MRMPATWSEVSKALSVRRVPLVIQKLLSNRCAVVSEAAPATCSAGLLAEVTAGFVDDVTWAKATEELMRAANVVRIRIPDGIFF